MRHINSLGQSSEFLGVSTVGKKTNKKLLRGPCQRTKKVMEHKGDRDINCSFGIWNSPRRLVRETRTIGN